MSLDSATDPLLEALATLIRDHVNGETAATLGEDAIRTVYQHPEILALAAQAELPCLSIVRGPEGGISRSVLHLDHRVQIVVDYVSPPTARENLGKRWPLLNLVWRELLEAVTLGHSAHYTGAGGASARPLDDVGVMFFFPASVSKVDRYAEAAAGDGGFAYPAFRATFDLEVRTTPGVATIGPVSIFASLDLRDTQIEEGTASGPVAGHVRTIAPRE